MLDAIREGDIEALGWSKTSQKVDTRLLDMASKAANRLGLEKSFQQFKKPLSQALASGNQQVIQRALSQLAAQDMFIRFDKLVIAVKQGDVDSLPSAVANPLNKMLMAAEMASTGGKLINALRGRKVGSAVRELSFAYSKKIIKLALSGKLKDIPAQEMVEAILNELIPLEERSDEKSSGNIEPAADDQYQIAQSELVASKPAVVTSRPPVVSASEPPIDMMAELLAMKQELAKAKQDAAEAKAAAEEQRRRNSLERRIAQQEKDMKKFKDAQDDEDGNGDVFLTGDSEDSSAGVSQ